ncbi:MAG: lipid-A-disaccharide synthase N-terminal domain-containing protein [Bacteroidales bacterium]
MIYVIGFLAQAFFAARTLLQWILSERARKVLSPSIYWILSILGSYLFFIYGWLRDDFAIILGQFISYYIYLWNLDQKGLWKKLHIILKLLLFATPFIAIVLAINDAQLFIHNFLQNDKIPLWLVIFGSMGQIIFTLRFVYQWFYSMKRKESLLPSGFWIISLIGSGVIISYGIIRLDPVLILGQSFGFIAYIRNIFIDRKSKNINNA